MSRSFGLSRFDDSGGDTHHCCAHQGALEKIASIVVVIVPAVAVTVVPIVAAIAQTVVSTVAPVSPAIRVPALLVDLATDLAARLAALALDLAVALTHLAAHALARIAPADLAPRLEVLPRDATLALANFLADLPAPGLCAGYSSTQVDNLSLQEPTAFKKGEYASVNLLHYPARNILVGGELLWGKREDNDGNSGEDVRTQITVKYNISSDDVR